VTMNTKLILKLGSFLLNFYVNLLTNFYVNFATLIALTAYTYLYKV